MTDETQAVPEQNDAPVAPETPVVEETSKAHPGWDKLLSELPEAWHGKVTPYLQDADRNFQQQLEKYTPFKDYVDQGVTPELISGGLTLARAIESNPLEVFDNLKNYLSENGMMPEEAAKEAASIMENESGEDFEDIMDDVPAALKKEIEDLKNFKSEQEKRQYEAELEKETQKYAVQLETEMTDLRSKYQITEAHEVAIYDLMNAAINAGREVSLADAAKQLQSIVGNFTPIGATPSEAPPLVVGSSGGAGVPAQNLQVPKDDKGKAEMMRKLFADYNKAQ